MYKSRQAIEVLFDSTKNVLEADHTYMQNEQTLKGWMFVNHITLQWYQHLYLELKKKSWLIIYSVNDYVQLLSDVKKVKINDRWYLNEITGQTQKMLEKLGLSVNWNNTWICSRLEIISCKKKQRQADRLFLNQLVKMLARTSPWSWVKSFRMISIPSRGF